MRAEILAGCMRLMCWAIRCGGGSWRCWRTGSRPRARWWTWWDRSSASPSPPSPSTCGSCGSTVSRGCGRTGHGGCTRSSRRRCSRRTPGWSGSGGSGSSGSTRWAPNWPGGSGAAGRKPGRTPGGTRRRTRTSRPERDRPAEGEPMDHDHEADRAHEAVPGHLGGTSRSMTVDAGTGPDTSTGAGPGPGAAMVLRRHYAADVADVWQACTAPERLARWLTPVSGELRPGGRYQLAGNAGGQVLRCEPPRLLVVSWEARGDQPVTRVTAELTPAGQAKAAADRTAAFYLPPA